MAPVIANGDDQEIRSFNMSQIAAHNTKPEIVFREFSYALRKYKITFYGIIKRFPNTFCVP